MEAPTPRRGVRIPASVFGLLLGLPFFVVWARMAPPAAADYVPVETTISGLSVERGPRGYRYLVVEGGGRRYQAENPFLRTTPYRAEDLRDALRYGEPITLWVESPDATTPRIRGLQTASVSIPVTSGVAMDRGERRAVLILALLFSGLGVAAAVETWWKRRRR